MSTTQQPCALCHTNETGFVCTGACEEHDSPLERRQQEIEDRLAEAAEWEARDRFIEGYDA